VNERREMVAADALTLAVWTCSAVQVPGSLGEDFLGSAYSNHDRRKRIRLPMLYVVEVTSRSG